MSMAQVGNCLYRKNYTFYTNVQSLFEFNDAPSVVSHLSDTLVENWFKVDFVLF